MLLLPLAVLLLAATAPAAQAHPRTLLEDTHGPTGSGSSSSAGIASPSKPRTSLNSKLPHLPWRQQQQHQQAAPSGIKPQGKDTKHSKEGQSMQSGFGNGQPAAKKLPKALHMEQPFQGLDPHGPFPDKPIPAAGQQPGYQRLNNMQKGLPRGPAAMKDLLLPMQGPSISPEPDMQDGKHHPGPAHDTPKGDKLPSEIQGSKPDRDKQHDNHAKGSNNMPSMQKPADMPNPGMPQPIFKLKDGDNLQAASGQPDLSGPASQQQSKVVDKLDLASAKRSLLQVDNSNSSNQKHNMPEGALANPSDLPPHEDATLNLKLMKQHDDKKHDKKPPKPFGPGMQGAMGNPSMPPAGRLATDPMLQQHDEPHHHGNGEHNHDHSDAKAALMQPGKADRGLPVPSLGNPSMRSPGYTVAYAEEQHKQRYYAKDSHHGRKDNKAMSFKPKSGKTHHALPAPMGSLSTSPQAAVAPDVKHHEHNKAHALEPIKGRDGMHVPMRNPAGWPLTVPPAGLVGHGVDEKHEQPHHERNLLAAVDVVGGTTPRETPAADSVLSTDSALTVGSESHIAKASQATTTASTANNKKGGLLDGRITYMKSASKLPAIKIDFRSQTAREKQPNPGVVSATEVAKKTGSPNANLLEGLQPMPIIDPGMLAAMLSGPPGMAGQWGPAWGR